MNVQLNCFITKSEKMLIKLRGKSYSRKSAENMLPVSLDDDKVKV